MNRVSDKISSVTKRISEGIKNIIPQSTAGKIALMYGLGALTGVGMQGYALHKKFKKYSDPEYYT